MDMTKFSMLKLNCLRSLFWIFKIAWAFHPKSYKKVLQWFIYKKNVKKSCKTLKKTRLLSYRIYRVSQKFVPLISCTTTFDQNFIFTWNFWKMYISLSSTGIQNFSNWLTLLVLFCFVLFFFFLSHSVAVAAWKWDTVCRPTDDPFELFYHLVRRSQFNPQTIFF